MKKFFSWSLLLLILILLLGTFLRFYKIDIPLADHHSWRQADTAAVARNFYKEGWDFFRPRIDNLTYLHTHEILNPDRLFLAEPPLYQSVVAVFYHFFGVKEFLARMVSIFFFVGAMIFLYLLSGYYFGKRVGLFSAFFFAVLPYSIFYSRVILPEPMILFLILGMLYFFCLWLEEEKNLWWVLAIFFAIFTFTQKSFPLFLGLPLAYLTFKKYSLDCFKQPKIWLFLLFSFLPVLAWRIWINQTPQGIPPYDWLFNEGGIRFKGAFFWWIFSERLGKLILGYWGLIPFGLGIILKPQKKEGWFFHFWLLAVLVYVCVFAAGNVTHDYYQIPFLPILCVFLAKGVNFLLFEQRESFSRLASYLLFIICCLFMLSFSWREVRDFYNIQGGVDLAGRAVDKLTPKDALILTGDSNDATLLYNTNRYGYTGGYASYLPNTVASIQKARNLGVTFYVSTKFEENSFFGQYMLNNYKVLEKTDQYIIFSL